jgi:hypothetical protein
MVGGQQYSNFVDRKHENTILDPIIFAAEFPDLEQKD